MKTLYAIWLVFYKGYSVIRFTGWERRDNGAEYGACNAALEGDYGFDDGSWGTGETPTSAIIDCYRKANSNK